MNLHVDPAHLMNRILNVKSDANRNSSKDVSFKQHANELNEAKSLKQASKSGSSFKGVVSQSSKVRTDRVLFFKEKISQSTYIQSIDYNKLSEQLIKPVLDKDISV